MRISDWSSDVCSSDLVDQSVNPDRRHAVSLGSIGDDLDGLQALKGAQALDAAKNAVARAVERFGGEQMERGDGGVARADIDPARVERVGEPARARYVARPQGRRQPGQIGRAHV